MFVRFQFKSTTFAELVRDQIARSDVGCIPPTGSGFVVERIVFPSAGTQPMDVDHSGEVVLPTHGLSDVDVDIASWVGGRPEVAIGSPVVAERGTVPTAVLGTD